MNILRIKYDYVKIPYKNNLKWRWNGLVVKKHDFQLRNINITWKQTPSVGIERMNNVTQYPIIFSNSVWKL